MSVFREPKPRACPTCERLLDAASGGPGTVPTKGDYSVCFYCGSLAVFTGKGLERRLPTEAELVQALMNPAVTRAIDAAASVRRMLEDDE